MFGRISDATLNMIRSPTKLKEQSHVHDRHLSLASSRGTCRADRTATAGRERPDTIGQARHFAEAVGSTDRRDPARSH